MESSRQDASHVDVGSERLDFAVQAAEGVLRKCLPPGGDSVDRVVNGAKHATGFPVDRHQTALDIMGYICKFHAGSGKSDFCISNGNGFTFDSNCGRYEHGHGGF